jgi:hypothetical protein
MDDSLRLIQYLYGESVDDPAFPERVADDEDLRRELEDMQEVKAALDRRPSSSPDADVVDGIVDRATQAARTDRTAEHAADRAARAPDRNWTRRLQNAGAALALLLAVGTGWWYMPGNTASTGASPDASAASGPAQAGDALPEWDDRDEVVRLHRRIELLQTQSRSDTWGGDLQPASRATP